MLEFNLLTLEQIPLLHRYFSRCDDRLCDHTVGGVIMWRKAFQTEYFLWQDVLFLRARTSDGWQYSLPVGDVEKGLRYLKACFEKTGESPVFAGIPRQGLSAVAAVFPTLSVRPTRDWFDYLYRTEDLRTLGGKKLAGQRNHRNFFMKENPSARFVALTEDNLGVAAAFLDEYYRDVDKEGDFFRLERDAVYEVLSHWSEFGFVGGMLLRPEGPVSLSFGEIVGDTIFIHVEKALRSVRGAYPMTVSSFLNAYGTVPYVNREEDVGDAGLRYSKESYHPIGFVEKYKAREDGKNESGISEII